MKLLIDLSYKMPHLVLFLGVTWTLYRPTYPLTTTKPALAMPNEGNEYEYEDSESPGQINKPASGEQKLPSQLPFFESNNTVVHAKLNESLQLDCPVKNYNNAQHVIMWYKENTAITNGNQILQPEIYQLATNFNLTVKLLTNDTLGNYYCDVKPQSVRRHITVKSEDAGAAVAGMKDAACATSSSSFVLLLCLAAASLPLNFRRDVLVLNY